MLLVHWEQPAYRPETKRVLGVLGRQGPPLVACSRKIYTSQCLAAVRSGPSASRRPHGQKCGGRRVGNGHASSACRPRLRDRTARRRAEQQRACRVRVGTALRRSAANRAAGRLQTTPGRCRRTLDRDPGAGGRAARCVGKWEPAARLARCRRVQQGGSIPLLRYRATVGAACPPPVRRRRPRSALQAALGSHLPAPSATPCRQPWRLRCSACGQSTCTGTR